MIDELNSSVWATLRPSSVHGIGVFAIRDIPKGTQITNHSVHKQNSKVYHIPASEFGTIHPAIQKLILDRTLFQEGQSELSFFSPNFDACLRSFMNHSVTPNSDGEYALREIKENEEITENYLVGELHPLTRTHYKHFLDVL